MDYHDLETDKQDEEEQNDENVELSDVIEVIETDPDFKESTVPPPKSIMLNGGTMEISPSLHTSPSQQSSLAAKKQARIRIVEQPAQKALRFRYECEGRSAGSIPGANSTSESKTYPTIKVEGYQGRAVVVVSCVTRDAPYKPHPHNLVGREGCKRGVCTLEIPTDSMTVHFSNLGIQCVKKKDIEHALRVREEIRVDPFRTGFSHRNQPTSIDLNVVRLCFQVFLEGDVPGKFSVPLQAVVSDPIYDKKAMSDLTIIKLSDCVSYVDGGRKDIILLCEKVAKEDIQIRFFEESSNWEAFAEFQPSQVHKQHAIWFRTPRYKTNDVTEPVKVFIQLRRPSDGATSEALPFELWPPERNKRKRPNKYEGSDQLLGQIPDIAVAASAQFPISNFDMGTVKTEPRGTPSPYAQSLSPYNNDYMSQCSYSYQPNILSPENTAQSWASQMTPQLSIPDPLPAMGTWNNNLGSPVQRSVTNMDNGEVIPDACQSSFPNLESLSDILETQNMSDSINKLVNNRVDEFY